MNIAIFGAGAAGLMTAISLCAHGHRCRIYERTRLTQEAGMGFILMPEGLSLMRGYGVELPVVPLRLYRYRDSAGNILREEAMPEGSGGIQRRDLISALQAALAETSTLTFGAELDDLKLDRSGKVISAHLVSGAGPANIQADLYVGADGIHSCARRSLFPGWPAAPAPVLELVGRVRCAQTIAWTDNNFNKFHAPEGGLALGIVPVDAEHVVWYLQFDATRRRPPREIEGPEARRDFMQRAIGGWGHPIPSLIAQTDFNKVYFWRPLDIDMVPYFYRKNLVLVGDAAHPLSPFTSQGVSAAIADADALARALSSAGMEQALELYSRERRALCAPFVDQGRELIRRFLAPHDATALSMPIAK